MLNIDELKFDGGGLIPAIIIDDSSGDVLTLAYMNRESLEITISEGRTCFWSRSRQELWRKGETSGNYQSLVSITADCDRDALLIRVVPDGPACHLGTESCFEFPVDAGDKIADNRASTISIDYLYRLLGERYAERPEGSYTSYLFDSGREKILKKVGEENAEVIIAAMKGSHEELVYELSDLLYHSLVLMVNESVSPREILAELASRHVPQSEKAEDGQQE